MRSRIRSLLAAAVFSTSLVVVYSSGTASADLGTGNTISVLSGNNGTTFALNVVAPSNACQGDTSVGGYRFHQYITTADPATLGFAAGAITAPGGAFIQPLYSTTGSPQINKATAINTGQLVGLSTLNFNTNTLPGNGVYNIGFICVLAGVVTRHWVTPITVTGFVAPSTFNWFAGPDGVVLIRNLVLDGTSPTGGILTGSFAIVPAIPAVTGYTVTLSPGGATVTIPAVGPYTFSFSGLTNGTAYTASVAATTAVGSSRPTTATTTVGVDNVPAPVVVAPSSPSPVLITIVPAATPLGAVLLNHVVTIPGVPGSPFILPAGTNTLSVTGASFGSCGNSFSFTVQATYNAPFVGDTFSGTNSILCAQVVVQDITVVRPQGALVLTQRCGVFGSAAAYSDTTFGTLPALAATADADTIGAIPAGTAPIIDLDGTGPGTATGPDSLFAQYPYPVDSAGIPNPNYPTNCAIDLGTGSLITSGPRAGQYFKATGRIAQITVINTRDADSGWTLNGRMSDFTSTTDATDTFSGNLLGWNPEVTWDSTANLDGYDMTVTAGGVRQPEPSSSTTGLGAGFNSTNMALASSLAQATPGASLGQAVMDARLRLLIPVTADAGTYTGVLTFTTI
jgi:hypothetical protein